MVKQRKNIPKLKIPSYDDGEDSDEGRYRVDTMEEKIICKYTGYDFDRLEDMEVFEYWHLLKDAVIYNRMQTEEGREYLEKCYRLEQTEPNRQAIREKIARKEG